jgi:transcriptional regulator with PAS, ATPase and Fis domain
LYYRLNVFRIDLPDLKDRRVDLPLLIHHILRKLSAARDGQRVGISKAAMEILLNFDYAGNVRELENILEHALIICREDLIEPGHLPTYLAKKKPARKSVQISNTSGGSISNSAERDNVLKTLEKFNWHRENTARALRIDRTTLWRKMKKYGLQ